MTRTAHAVVFREKKYKNIYILIPGFPGIGMFFWVFTELFGALTYLRKMTKKNKKFSLIFKVLPPIMVVKSGLKWWEMEIFPAR